VTAILAFDAAWTVAEPSGIALLRGTEHGWTCAGLAPRGRSIRPGRLNGPGVLDAVKSPTSKFGGSALDAVDRADHRF
jgi:hypothetical protein